jgi:hypothetical protein
MSTGRRPAILAVLPVALAIAVGVWWAVALGYVPPLWEGAVECTLEGYDPLPTYNELESQHDKTRYCARLTRGEAWF